MPNARPPRAPKPRVRLLDALRGFSVLSMTGYHAMYDLYNLFGAGRGWYNALPGHLWQQSICWVFILVAGASLHYGSRRWRHALLVCGCAALLSALTGLLAPRIFIAFGVLHMLGCCMLLAAALRVALQAAPPALGFALCAALFVLTKRLPYGGLGLLDWQLVNLPAALYQTGFLFPLGLPGPGFYSSDYFPLFPWLFLFFAGYFGWALVKRRFAPAVPGANPLEWLGRHSLLVYMLHQPLIAAGIGLYLLLAGAGLPQL